MTQIDFFLSASVFLQSFSFFSFSQNFLKIFSSQSFIFTDVQLSERIDFDVENCFFFHLSSQDFFDKLLLFRSLFLYRSSNSHRNDMNRSAWIMFHDYHLLFFLRRYFFCIHLFKTQRVDFYRRLEWSTGWISNRCSCSRTFVKRFVLEHATRWTNCSRTLCSKLDSRTLDI